MIDVSNNAASQSITALSKSVTDGVNAFYGLPDDRFAKQVHEFTRNDPRLSLLFFATRQRYQQHHTTPLSV